MRIAKKPEVSISGDEGMGTGLLRALAMTGDEGWERND